MKKIICSLLVLMFSFLSNAQDKKYVTFQAEIANRNTDSIFIRNNKKIIKKITVNKNGVFKDTLNVVEGPYVFFDGVEYTSLYLKNGYDLKLKMDAKDFDASIVYTGKGSLENNYLAQRTILDSKYDYDALLAASPADFKKLSEQKIASELAQLNNGKFDPNFVIVEKKDIEQSLVGLTKYYEQGQENKKMNNLPSPTFDYLNYAGGQTKLEDLKGKYVFIDVWATWCGPCRQEIPFLQEIEKKYHDKNITFVSISIDKLKDQEKWKTMIKDKSLGGVQLFADNDWNSKFVKDYKITGIPRFILIDPKGIIVKADATRPSSPDLVKELDSLLN
ncbi:TlpA family protein disulfide reductase [Flavobacterium sp. N3904]|uniref:TlpA family protein disulfide reductase n=1 Tax=Flavobacterium sp. N3904 TaxID=2986835 RepID=UPI002225A581|nr:TlpA disulfide reductase family protein [Flavobacterium sp. N3904]